MSKERLDNGTVVDVDTIPTEQLIALIEAREAQIAALQAEVDGFFATLKQRHQQASAECGDV